MPDKTAPKAADKAADPKPGDEVCVYIIRQGPRREPQRATVDKVHADGKIDASVRPHNTTVKLTNIPCKADALPHGNYWEPFTDPPDAGK